MNKNEIMSKTKIVCTIGPASETKEMLTKLVKAGMNVMRLNFSHGTHEEHEEKINTLLEINKELSTNVAILLDTKGPEIRTGDFVGGKTTFKKGQTSTICVEDIEGTSERFTITYKDLYKDVKPGGFILVNDGQVELLVDHVDGTDIVCICANDGEVKNKRGINVPGIKLGFDYLSPKDISDLTFGANQPFDYVAASFCRRAQDIVDIKKLLIENGRNDIQILAKIENQEGVENVDEILDIADGIMVARGDLGVEVPAEDVPLMLSGESASGLYPQEAVLMMSKIAHKIESSLDYQSLQRQAIRTAPDDTSEAICMSVAEIAYKFNVAAIIAFTESGFTARKMARYRTKSRIIAATPSLKTVKALALNWGVKAVPCKQLNSRISMIDYASIIARENGVKPGQKILVTGGTPGVKGATSYLELVEVK